MNKLFLLAFLSLLLIGSVSAVQYTVSCESDSMMPTLKCNDRVFATTHPSIVGLNDIIVYESPFNNSKGKLIAHRIIKIEPDYYTTQGDNTDSIERFPKEFFVAKIVGFKRGLKITRFRNGRMVMNDEEKN